VVRKPFDWETLRDVVLELLPARVEAAPDAEALEPMYPAASG
jgi:hypothetical protein